MLFPQWGTKDPSGVQSRLYFRLSIRSSVRLSVSLSGLTRRLLAIIRSARNCAQRMRPHVTGSNPLSGSIIYLSFCPSIRSSVGLLRFLYLYSFTVLGSSVAMYVLIYKCMRIILYVHKFSHNYHVIYVILYCSHLYSDQITLFNSYSEKGITFVIPTLGPKGPQWGPVELICMSVCLSFYLSLFPSVYLPLWPVVCVAFWRSKRMARNCVQRMWPQATG